MRPERAAGVRTRVVAVAAAATLLTLAVAGVGLVLAQERLLTDGVDAALRERAHDLLAGPVQAPMGGPEDAFAQWVSLDGRVLAAAPGSIDLPVAPAPPPGRVALRSQAVAGLEPGVYRVLSQHAGTRPGRVLHVGASLDDVRDSARVLTRSLGIAVPTVTALLALGVWWLVGRALRPVEEVRREVEEIGAGDLHRRVSVPRGDDEVVRLTRTMNAMLDRVEAALGRQQRFVADASHELRTPLTRIRAEVEVDLARPGTADVWATHRSILEETADLQELVDDLLVLARSDGPGGPVPRSEVDLDDVVLEEARRARVHPRVQVRTAGVQAVRVIGDPAGLSRVVRNLLENAVRHAASGVDVALVERDGRAVLSVADDGPGIAEEDRDRVFERFARLDRSRDSRSGGTGLGLAIALEVVRGHGGTIRVATAPRGGAELVVDLPCVPECAGGRVSAPARSVPRRARGRR